MNAVDLASLLCSRLCHDLMSPVGRAQQRHRAARRRDDPDMRENCLELLADSARASANKLKFFRLAFGAAGGFGEEIDTREAQAALEGAVRRRAADRARLGGRRPTSCPRAPSSCCSTSRCSPATRWCAAAGSTSAPNAGRRDRDRRSAPKGRGSCSIPRFARRSPRRRGGRSSRAPPAPGWRTAWPRRRAARSSFPTPASEAADDRRRRLPPDRDNAALTPARHKRPSKQR